MMPRTASLFLALLFAVAGVFWAPSPAPAQGAAEPPPRPLAFGEVLRARGCLAFSLESHRAAETGVEAPDWVSLRLENGCAFPVRHLEVALLLIDLEGGFFGVPLWVLEQGVLLPPGRTLRERFPVPNPDRRLPRGWYVRVLQAEGLGPAGWAPLPAPSPAEGG